tara:strand:+ start:122 stop:367 length:246 start_codon:yes stop_codon:yes gene_type:complete
MEKTNIDLLPFPNLFKEFENFLADFPSPLEKKVQRIHMLCLKSRKFGLADRIQEKYHSYFPNDDMVIAFGMAMVASRKVTR